MKIIFLDIDGVLNSAAYFQETRNSKQTRHEVDIRTLPILQHIIKETGAKIVLSSTWRNIYLKQEKFIKVKSTFDLLRTYDIEIFDTTIPCGAGLKRNEEIGEWLSRHPEITEFVVLDDDFLPGDEYIRSRLVQSSWYDGYGITMEHAQRAIKMLNGI